MADQGFDLLSGETAVSENGTGVVEQEPHLVDATTAVAAAPQQEAPSVDLLGFGDAAPASAVPATQAYSDFDVFASSPVPPKTEASTDLLNGGAEVAAPAIVPPAPLQQEEPIVPPPPSSQQQQQEEETIVPPPSSQEKTSEDPETPALDNTQQTAQGNDVNAETTANLRETPPTESSNEPTVEVQAGSNGKTLPADGDTPTETTTPPLSQSTEASSADDGIATTASTTETEKKVEEIATNTAVGNNESSQPPPTENEATSTNEPTPLASTSLLDSASDMDQLRAELEETKAELERLKSEQAQRMEDDGALLMELQSKLQEHMSARAEAENKVRLSEQSLQSLTQQNEEQAQKLQKYHEMDESWQEQKAAKADIENEFRDAQKQITKMEEEKDALREIISNLEKEVEELQRERMNQEEEVKAIRDQRDEQERREIALTNRLNAAKKKEADKANLAEHFEDEMKALRDDAKQARDQVEELTAAKASLEDELARTKTSSDARTRQAEIALADEKRLNEDRKGKMKAFIEKKSEELRQAKADSESLQTELNQTSRSLVDLNNRWKQLHAQWVQSQTRNRELQRDLNRIKKDSENLHKVGDTLEMKLSRSATETEEHKNKRLAAKNELMTVLKTLEAEREVSSRLRDAIKFTFTPKALSQQQLLK